MAVSPTHAPLVFAFGVLGNIASFVVFLAPVPTFVRICKKKSTEGFQSLPYLIALFSAMLWLCYAMLKSDAFLLITINSVGCLIETIYIVLHIVYAPKTARVFTLRVFLLLNFAGYCSILFLSHFLAKGPFRVTVLGWICTAFSVSVFVAPLSIMRVVIKTKSVEFMPFHLSFFLTLSAIMWLFYGLLLKDFYIAVPNIIGFIFGVLQMVLYVIYKRREAAPLDLNILALQNGDVEKAMNLTIASCCELQKPASPIPDNNNNDHDDGGNSDDRDGNLHGEAACDHA